MRKNYNIVSLFSGCGGLDLGFQRFKGRLNNPDENIFDIIWSCDINEAATKTYAKNFGAKRYNDLEKMYQGVNNNEEIVYQGDLRKVEFSKIKNNRDVDLVLGGFPCQDFSMLRGKKKRKGIKVKRGRLYLEFVKSLVELQPKMFIAENVKGLRSANNGLAFKQIIDDFQNLNQNWDTIKDNLETNPQIPKDLNNYKILFSEVVNFSQYGVPQNRERLIIIGVREDLLRTDLKQELESLLTEKLAEEIFPVVPLELFEGKLLDQLEDEYETIMKDYETNIRKLASEKSEHYLKEVWANYSFDIYQDYCKENKLSEAELKDKWSEISKKHQEVLKEIGAWGVNVEEKSFADGSNKKARSHNSTKERLKHIPPGENHVFVRGTDYSVKGLMSNIYKRLHPLVPSPTVIAKGGGGTWGYHYTMNRDRLTNRERARIQTFPDNFAFVGGKSDVRAQIGNAVPPLGAKQVAGAVLAVLENITSSVNKQQFDFQDETKEELVS